jgi:cytochrome c-type biogenesis protein CcsB
MKLNRVLCIVCSVLLLVFADLARAGTDEDFIAKLNLKPLETLTVQHEMNLKTMDSFARQTLYTIPGRSAINGEPALYTVLDLAFRPENYEKQNLIKIRNVPVRQDLQQLKGIDDAEKQRILKQGTISLDLWRSDKMQHLAMDIQSTAIFKAEAVNQVYNAAGTLQQLSLPNLAFLRIIPPGPNEKNAKGEKNLTHWHSFGDIIGNVPAWVEVLKKKGGMPPPAPVAGYDGHETELEQVGNALLLMRDAWRNQDASTVNQQIATLAKLLPQVNPALYPSMAKRQVEVVYNHLAKMTIPGAAFYFVAFVLFLMAARSGAPRLRLWALRFFVLGFLIHTAGIAIRWWLVGSIPIKNQFESVMFSAWFGCALGLIFELRKPRSIFGAGASFVGWLSLIAIFTAPFVAGRDIGGEISHVNGVLMSYWLYIHVTLVTAAYALITMGFCLSAWWLVKYYSEYGTLSRVPGRQLSADMARTFEVVNPHASASGAEVSIAGGAVALTWGQTLARLLFIPAGSVASRPAVHAAANDVTARSRGFLAMLDQCNLVVLQLAFWVLGVGIICGAVWADESWGRPWGWDPKETFALVTWIVYLIVVHVRVATDDKAWWTALLSIVGFGVMLLNWIGVNYFLVGLHSYA